ncbi:MAG TPA: tetratricopeptide repeat protein, partial [Bacteroidia bacterium]|nr:tetratricopeptide repeat protein [Bacteroidia bacterium]
HNLGNSMLQQQKYQESINAYKQALKLKPNDEETRYNLAYAQSKLKKQNPPPKQNQNQKNNKQNKNQQRQQQQQQQQQQQSQQRQNQQQQQQQQEKNPAMSKEEAQRMLDALQDNEKKIRDRMNQKRNKSAFNRSKEKDW